GYNAFVFDFRAHGDSAGHLTSFGDLERRDVLGAVRWVRDHRPLMARRIVGVGASMGAAALIAAAADEGEDGRAIDAVAVYGTYDRVGSLARSVTDQYFLPPLNWLAVNIGLPLASVQVGTNLNAFSPAALAPRLWPRPILIVHGEQDEIIDVAHGQSLFEAATLPKSRFWIERGSHNSVVNDDNAALAVRRFFDTAKPVPVI
ncbi:MAG: alpha/beta hydrolase, partial [Tepidisphaeraceae bacterium]